MANYAYRLLLLSLVLIHPAFGQSAKNLGGRQALGVSVSYAPTSSDLLLGIAEKRRTLSLGGEYSRRLWSSGNFFLEYAGSIEPFFRESDPTLVGTISVPIAGFPPVIQHTASERVIRVSHAAIGESCGGSCVPIYGLYGRENTYAFAASPIGGRFGLFQGKRLQPGFMANTGFVIASRDLPIDNAAGFNYQFSFGPGVEVYTAQRTAFRLEYVFRHISNADSGKYNPGIDQGVFRLSLYRYW